MILDSMLKIEVLSMGTFSDRLVGWTELDIEPALHGLKMEDWYTLSGKQGDGKEGKINLVIGFRPFAPPAVAMQRRQAVPMYPMGVDPYSTAPPVYGQDHPPPAPYGRGPMHPGQPRPPTQPVYQPTGMPVVGYPSQSPGQQQPPAGGGADPAAVQQLRDMFPDLDNSVVESVLASSQGNVERALETLLSMS
mmetsp:Transcript_28660/g.86002  ORF Transcript_28660/g.86002 Transcript_28660/m.86002 type:complete len:192 (+) Transcript_28660:1183-1758(+)